MAKIALFGDFKVDEVAGLSISEGLKNTLSSSDINVVNFEAPMRGAGKPIRKSGPSISQSTDSPAWLEQHGFNVISLANNHTMDYGVGGMEATRKALSKTATIGCGNWEEAYRPLVIKAEDGMRVGFLACTHCEFGTLTDSYCEYEKGTAWLMHPDIDRAIQKVKTGGCDFLIVLAHAGVEYMDVPLPEIRDRYKRLIELGADAVIASHPHVPQGWEMYQGKPICYSLGNFCFTKQKKGKMHARWYESLCCILDIGRDHDLKMIITPVIYDQENHLILENTSKHFGEYLNNLNELLTDNEKYMESVNKEVKKLLSHYMNQFSRGGLGFNPFSIGFVKGLAEGCLGLGFFKKEHWLNNLQCESHRWAILRAMKLKES